MGAFSMPAGKLIQQDRTIISTSLFEPQRTGYSCIHKRKMESEREHERKQKRKETRGGKKCRERATAIGCQSPPMDQAIININILCYICITQRLISIFYDVTTLCLSLRSTNGRRTWCRRFIINRFSSSDNKAL